MGKKGSKSATSATVDEVAEIPEATDEEMEAAKAGGKKARAKKEKLPKEPRPVKNPCLGCELANVVVFVGANHPDATQPEVTRALESLGASFEGVGGKAGAGKFVADRLWYGRHGKMRQADLTGDQAKQVAEAIAAAREAIAAEQAESDAAKAAEAEAKKAEKAAAKAAREAASKASE